MILQKLLHAKHLLGLAAGFVVAFTLLAALPAITIPLGLPPEGDAVDYRIPLLHWMVSEGTIPNWSWSVVDDYPILGELLMIPFYLIHPGLARLVPIAAHLLTGLAAGLIFLSLSQNENKPNVPIYKNIGFWLAFAWCLPLRPLAIQSNLLMLDNLASACALLALWRCLEGKANSAGVFFGLALASKYMIWAASPALLLAWFFANGFTKTALKGAASLILVSALFVLPHCLRNFIVNEGNPFFPMFLSAFGQEGMIRADYGAYGRGKDFISLLLLPWDILVTNGIQRDLFDYSIGKLFFAQALACVLTFIIYLRRKLSPEQPELLQSWWSIRSNQALLAFMLMHTVAWFFTSQQLRFLVPTLIVFNLLMFRYLFKRLAPLPMAALVLLGALSITSIQKDSWLMVFRGKPSFFQKDYARFQECLSGIPQVKEKVIGHLGRDGVLGFAKTKFVFMPTHVYYAQSRISPAPSPEYIYSPEKLSFPNYEPHPGKEHCLLQRKASGSIKD